MKLTFITLGVLAFCPFVQCRAQTTPDFHRDFPPVIGPATDFQRGFVDHRGLSIGQQGFGTAIGEQGTTPAPVFGPRERSRRGLGIFSEGAGSTETTSFIGQGFSIRCNPQANIGFIGPRGFNGGARSDIATLAINAQASSIVIGDLTIGGNPGGMVGPAVRQTFRNVRIAQSPNNIFVGKAVTVLPVVRCGK
jgi:hypothetical protein